MITRGDTITHYFRLPFATSSIKNVWVDYMQDDELVMEKTLNECYFDGQYFVVFLGEPDTLCFHKVPLRSRQKDSLVVIQLRVLLSNGLVKSCRPIQERINDVINDAPIGGRSVSSGYDLSASQIQYFNPIFNQARAGESHVVDSDDVIIYDGGDVFGYGQSL